jgi:phosphoglycolate phosphatase-like HAD superfamily hydrolase
MIGDQPQDIRAARANGIRSIAALWGFGAKNELLAANADASADHIKDVVSVVTTWAGRPKSSAVVVTPDKHG